MLKSLLAKGRERRGVISVEAAFAFPVLIITAMIVMELANIGLTIQVGEAALQRAMQQVRNDDSWEGDGEKVIRSNIVKASHGLMTDNDIVSVVVEEYDSLDDLGKALAEDGSGEDEENEEETTLDTYPAWRIIVDIRKDFITPLPRMLDSNEKDFQYHFEQVLSYLPRRKE